MISFLKSIKILLISFLSVSLLFLYIVFNIYSQEKVKELSNMTESLQTIGKLKANFIDKWLLERNADASFLHNNSTFNRLLHNLIVKPNRTDSISLAAFLLPMANNHDYENIFIIDKDVNILLNLRPSASIKINSDSLNSSTAGNKLLFSTLYADSETQKNNLDIYVPVLYNDTYTATVILKVDPEILLYPLTSWHDRNSTGESYIISQSENIKYLSPLKFPSDSRSIESEPSDINLIASKAFNRVEGIWEGIDYRRVEVLADVRKLNIADWYLVSKIDLAEVYFPVSRYFRNNIIILCLIFFLGGLSLFYYHTRQNYIQLKKLNESESKLKVILEHSTNLFYSHTTDHTLTYVSPQSHSILGYKPEELMLSWKTLTTDNKINETGSEFTEKAILTGKVQPPYELELRKKDGSLIWVEVHEAPVVKDGQTIAIVGALTPVTKNKMAEKALYESEEIFRHFMENSPFFIFFKDENIRAIKLSKNFEEILGRPLNEIIGKSMDELFPSDLAKSMIEDDKRILLEGKTVIVNEEFNERYYTTIKFPIIIDDRTRYLAGYSIDNTEHTLAEQALRESETKYRHLFENMLDGAYKCTPDGKFVEVNQSLVKMFGYETIEEMMAADILFDLHFRPGGFQNGVSGESLPQMHIYKVIRKDGSEIWVEDHGLSVRDEKGKILYYEGILRDVTGRRQAEERIKTLSKALEQSPVSVVITDPQGNIEYVNSKFTELSQYSIKEVLGKNPRILKSGETPQEEYTRLWESIVKGKECRLELHNRKKNGELYWVDAIISPIVNDENEIIHFIGIEEDITEKKKMIRELIVSKEKAEEMNRIKSYFFANMSHELRTPFVSIIGYAELLLQNNLQQESRQMVEAILDSSGLLMDTLNKILTLTKLEFEPPSFSMARVDVNELLDECHRTFYPAADRKNLLFKVHKLPGSLIINSDTKLLRDILYNFISNAIKFTTKGSVEVWPLISYRGTDEYLTVTISDTGIGMPKEKQEQIWLPFRQISEGFNRSFQGTGLGLTIAKKYLEILGANVHLESELNKGSRFTLDFPLTRFK